MGHHKGHNKGYEGKRKQLKFLIRKTLFNKRIPLKEFASKFYEIYGSGSYSYIARMTNEDRTEDVSLGQLNKMLTLAKSMGKE